MNVRRIRNRHEETEGNDGAQERARPHARLPLSALLRATTISVVGEGHATPREKFSEKESNAFYDAEAIAVETYRRKDKEYAKTTVRGDFSEKMMSGTTWLLGLAGWYFVSSAANLAEVAAPAVKWVASAIGVQLPSYAADAIGVIGGSFAIYAGSTLAVGVARTGLETVRKRLEGETVRWDDRELRAQRDGARRELTEIRTELARRSKSGEQSR